MGHLRNKNILFYSPSGDDLLVQLHAGRFCNGCIIKQISTCTLSLQNKTYFIQTKNIRLFITFIFQDHYMTTVDELWKHRFVM